MADYIVRAESLSKRYRIHPTVGQGWHRNQHVLVDDIMQIGNKLRGRASPGDKVAFWALKDVSFEARQGEVIGIIGRNGAGKSTLLKLLSRVTEPTSGRATIYGRVGTLLEVGTGFHSELTGRENIFISGAIIGMSRAEIKRKFDEIVAFSEVGEFLDTPVKRFSSGMEVRLAFSVAAHLNPQLLLVDEVLAVGDAAFQQKSLNKIKEVAHNGGTILFVSHNMTTVASSCSQALVLEHGKVAYPLASTTQAIDYYLASIEREQRVRLEEGRQGGSAGTVRIAGFGMRDAHGVLVDTLTSGMPVSFQVEYATDRPASLEEVNLSIKIKTLRGDVIASLDSQAALGLLTLAEPQGRLTCHIPRLPLAAGNISISLSIEQNGQILDMIQDAYIGEIDSGGYYEKKSQRERSGWLLIDQDWRLSTGQEGAG